MKINLSKSGGLAGLSGSISIDTESLSEKERRQIKELLKDSNFFSLPSKIPFEKSGAADYTNYIITIEDGNNKNSVKANDISIPSKLMELISFIESKYDYSY
jgi:hypothetical protein